jgi:ubiquilin
MDAMGPTAPPPTTTANTGTHAANQQAGAVGAAMPNPWGAPPRSSPRNAATTGSSASASNTNNPWAMPPAAGPNMANPWALPTSNNLLQPPSTDQLEQTIQLLESNPHMQQMMDQMLADPATLQTMMQMDPRMQQVMQQNPAMAQMMQDPQFIRTMMNPASLRAMMQLQNSMGGAGPGAGGAMMPPMPMMRMPPPSYNLTPPPPQTPLTGGLDFSNLLQQMQSSNIHNPGDSPFGASSAFGGATPPFASMFAAPPFLQQQQQHPADRYHRQLASLRDMGFDDEQLCLRALEVNHGNLNRAVDMMIDGSVPGIGGTSATTATTTQTQQQQQQEDTTTTAAPPAPEQDGAPKDSTEKKND